MIGSLPFHGWLNWVWYKKVGSQPYEDFFQSFLRKYWAGQHALPCIPLRLCSAFFKSKKTAAVDTLWRFRGDNTSNNSLDLLCTLGMVDHQTIERGDAA